MTPLANAIYKQLRRQAIAGVPSITYGDLVKLLGKKHESHPRSRRLYAALTEVTVACRAADLPCLPALVCRADLQRPSDGYYAVAHPRLRTEPSRIEAWQREVSSVLGAADRYPSVLDDSEHADDDATGPTATEAASVP